MPSQTERQRKLFGAALSYKRGNRKNASKEAKKLAKELNERQLKDFARKPVKRKK